MGMDGPFFQRESYLILGGGQSFFEGKGEKFLGQARERAEGGPVTARQDSDEGGDS